MIGVGNYNKDDTLNVFVNVQFYLSLSFLTSSRLPIYRDPQLSVLELDKNRYK